MIKKEELEMFKSSLQAVNRVERGRIIKESFNLINPDKMNDWVIFVSNEQVPTNAIKAIVSVMSGIESGIPFDDAEINVFKSGTVDPRLAPLTSVAVVNFSKKGEEYRNYWINEYKGKER